MVFGFSSKTSPKEAPEAKPTLTQLRKTALDSILALKIAHYKDLAIGAMSSQAMGFPFYGTLNNSQLAELGMIYEGAATALEKLRADLPAQSGALDKKSLASAITQRLNQEIDFQSLEGGVVFPDKTPIKIADAVCGDIVANIQYHFDEAFKQGNSLGRSY